VALQHAQQRLQRARGPQRSHGSSAAARHGVNCSSRLVRQLGARIHQRRQQAIVPQQPQASTVTGGELHNVHGDGHVPVGLARAQVGGQPQGIPHARPEGDIKEQRSEAHHWLRREGWARARVLRRPQNGRDGGLQIHRLGARSR
jgi:hypothetical protein